MNVKYRALKNSYEFINLTKKNVGDVIEIAHCYGCFPIYSEIIKGNITKLEDTPSGFTLYLGDDLQYTNFDLFKINSVAAYYHFMFKDAKGKFQCFRVKE